MTAMEFSTLNEAAREGQHEIVTLLLQHGAKAGYQPLWNAVWNSHPHDGQRTADHFEKTVKILLDAGARKNLSSDIIGKHASGQSSPATPLSNEGHPNAARCAGLSLEAKNDKGLTVIGMAREAFKSDIVFHPFDGDDGLPGGRMDKYQNAETVVRLYCRSAPVFPRGSRPAIPPYDSETGLE